MTTKPTTLAMTISEVIENLTLMIVDEPKTHEGFAPQLRGQIEFTGPVNGVLSIECSEILSQKLAVNLLGTEQETLETQADALDALGELLNVVCGNLVTSLYDSNRPFNLLSPKVDNIGPELSDDNKKQNHSDDDSQKAFMLLDGEPVEFTLSIKKI